MSIKEITVDDILDEIKQKSQERHRPVTSMDQVDALIKEILEKRQEQELGREKSELSLKEKKQFDDQVQNHVRVLTDQFDKMRPEIEKTLTSELSFSEKEDTGVKFQRIHKEQKVKLHATAELGSIPPIQRAGNEPRVEQLKRTIHTAQLRKDMKEIAGHFGEKHENEGQASQDSSGKLPISADGYKELRDARSKKIDSFILNPQKHPEASEQDTPAVDEEKPLKKRDKEEKRALPPNEFAFMEEETFSGILPYEYTSRSQKDEVKGNLAATLKGVTISLILLAVLSLVAIFLLFASVSGQGFNLLGFLNLSTRNFAIINTVVLIAGCGCSFSIFSNAFHSMAEHKPDKDIFYMLAVVIMAAISVVFCLFPDSLLMAGVNMYIPITMLGLFFNFLGKRIAVKKVITEFEYITENEEIYGAMQVTDNNVASAMLSGIDGLEGQFLIKNVRTGFFQNFLAHAFSADIGDIISSKLPAASLIAAAVAFGAGFFFSKNPFVGISAAAGVLSCAMGMMLPLLSILPIKDAADVVRHFAGYMPDHEQINFFADSEAVMLDANAFFPSESVLLHGIKTFQGNRIDEAIVDAASILVAANSVLKSVFLSIIADKKELLKPVDSIIYEDSMGISGWVNEKRVLIGNRELMIQHSIPVPKSEYEMKYTEAGQEMVYLSSEGVLCAAFVLQFTASGEGADLFALLSKNAMSAVIKTVDSSITVQLLARVFNIDVSSVKILPSRLHRAFDTEHAEVEIADLAMANNGNSFGHIVQLAVCKKLNSCIRLAKVLYWVSSAVALLLLLVAPAFGVYALAGQIQLLIVLLLFLVAYWIYEKNIRL